VFAAQYPSQVHSAVQQICSEILYAEGTTIWDDKLRNEKLLFKDCHLFNPSEFEVWYRDPKIRKNPVKVWVLATKHWKGIISSMDAHTFRIYDSFGLLERQDTNVSLSDTFGYKPYLVDSVSGIEMSAQDMLLEGHTLSEVEEKLDSYYKAANFKKKRIYEASNNLPFVAWKLEGKIPFPGPHTFQKNFILFWNILPAASYQGLKKLDLKITHQCMVWNKLNIKLKNDYILMWRLILGSFLWISSLVIVGIFDIHHPLLALVFSVGSFYLPVRLFKFY
jgi:hypothetical protein